MGKVPKLRFEGFEGDWEEKKLLDIFSTICNAFVGTASPYYVEKGHFYLESNNVKDGQINRNTEVFINDEFYERQREKWLHTGDMVMVQSGHVGHAAVIPDELDNTAAHALIMFKNPKVAIEPFFLNYQYQTIKAKKKIDNITTGNTIKHILASDMQAFVVDFTHFEEQKKIAEFFRLLDHLLTLHQRKHDAFLKAKQFYLQNLFPRKGEKTPRLRFAGFSGEWEEKKFGEWGTFYYGYSCPKWSVTPDANVPCVRYGELYTKFGAKISQVYSYTKIPAKHLKLSKGTEVLIPRVGEDPMDYNHCTWLSLEGVAIGEMISVFNSDQDPLFSAMMFNATLQKDFAIRVEGGSVTNLYYDKLMNIAIAYPSLEEQRKIAIFLDNIDHLIATQQRKLETLKRLKQFLLQNLFV